MQSKGLVELDGSYLEGGGQILRTAVGLSAVTGRAWRIFNIRKGRKTPGLRAQHLRGILAVARLCGADLTGAELGSTEVEFRPKGPAQQRHLSVDVGTAGAVTLVLQALMIPLVRSPRPVTVQVTGGTHVRWAPVVDYFEHVFVYYLRAMGCGASLLVERHGFYPRGGGKVMVAVRPGEPRAVEWTQRGAFRRNVAWSVASEGLKKARVAERQIEGASRQMALAEEHVSYVPSSSTGSAILICANYEGAVLGASVLGERGKPAEKVGCECALALTRLDHTGACLDEHMADQILPYMALAPQDSRASVAGITKHCRTNVWVIEQFLPVRFLLDAERCTITCRHV